MTRILIALALLLLAGCTYNVTLTVSLPGDPTPAVTFEPQPQTKPDTNL